jgi:hypothetical protein
MPDSRYAKSTVYPIVNRDGRTIMVMSTPEAPADDLLGYYRRREGERLDHLGAAYLGDGAQYWRMCELADVMVPDALAEAREIPIPVKTKG